MALTTMASPERDKESQFVRVLDSTAEDDSFSASRVVGVFVVSPF